MTTPPGPPGAPAPPSFETVYAVGLPFLQQALRWLGVAPNDLDDMLQEVFVAAHRRLPTYEPWRYHARTSDLPAGPSAPLRIPAEAALERWLFGIAWRKVSHYHARAHRRREIPSGAAAARPFAGRDPAPTPEQAIAGADRVALVSALLLKVPPARRTILVMYDLLDMPVADIARELQLNENTVRSRLRLAREDFRTAVRRLPREHRGALRGLDVSERSLRALADALLHDLRAARERPSALAQPMSIARAPWFRLTNPHVCVVSAPLARESPTIMANTPKWNIRLRHEWLATPLKKKRLKRCQKARIGLLDAEARKAAKKKPVEAEQPAS